jgi:L-alanine-DL-glutamate epimerase-like enolase superfamily enzyme
VPRTAGGLPAPVDGLGVVRMVESWHDEAICFVRITTTEGYVGWGQTSPYQADITATILHRQVVPWVLGADAGDVPGVVATVLEREHKFPGSHLYRAVAGVDTALWDLRGRVAGRPVAALLGAPPGTTLRAYASSMRRDIAPRAEAERLRRLCDTHGFTAAKWRVGAECGRDVDEWPGRTEEVVPVVAKALGEGVAKLVDANSGFSRRRAVAVGHLLQDHGVVHFEEPCPYWDLDATAAVTAALDLDVTGGEQDCELRVWEQITARRVVDVVQPDVMYLGGLVRTLEVVRMAQAAGIPCTPHSANRSLVTVAAMHLLAAIPNAGPYLELSIEGPDECPWQDGLFVDDPCGVEDGLVRVPDAPGWGVEVSPAWLARATRTVSTTN